MGLEAALRVIEEAARGGGDERALLAAIAECAKELRSGDVDVDRMEIAEALCGLLGHASPEVRQEIAELCDTFPEPYFTRALERLAGDADRFVQNAAKRAGERRARVRKERQKDETREQVLAELLGAIEEGQGGVVGRRLAERAVRRGIEHFVGRLDHEVRKSDRALERALAALDAEIDKEDRSPATLRRHAAELREHFGFVRSIIRRGRDYAAPRRATFTEESLAEIVEVARRQLCDRLGEQAGAVELMCDVDPELRMHCDRLALLQVFHNLLENSVQAYDAGRARMPLQVSARVLLAGAQVEIRVVDRGQGIRDEDLPKIFLPFGSGKPGGTGLGMLTAKKMIEDVHDGEIEVESVVDDGTTVIIRLPARQPGVRAGARMAGRR